MPYAATWMDLEIIILSEVSQTEKTNIIWYHLYVESKENDRNELTYKIQIDPQKTNIWLPKGKGGGGIN